MGRPRGREVAPCHRGHLINGSRGHLGRCVERNTVGPPFLLHPRTQNRWFRDLDKSKPAIEVPGRKVGDSSVTWKMRTLSYLFLKLQKQ